MRTLTPRTWRILGGAFLVLAALELAWGLFEIQTRPAGWLYVVLGGCFTAIGAIWLRRAAVATRDRK